MNYEPYTNKFILNVKNVFFSILSTSMGIIFNEKLREKLRSYNIIHIYNRLDVSKYQEFDKII